MRIAQALGGFSLGQADVLRKAMGKKDPKVMGKMREAFMEGARATGINEKKAAKIFDLMEYFAGYGFNKSHSTAYAFLAYQTAYLKANYPWHFAAALLTIEAQNTDKLAVYLAECRDRGVPILPPDINVSELNFSVEPGRGVRFGLTAIKGLGEGAIRAILDARRQLGGRIPSLHALCEVLDLRLVNKRVFEALVKSGACDSLVTAESAPGTDRPAHAAGAQPLRESRPRLLAAVDAAVESGSRMQRDRDLGQVDLFGGADRAVVASMLLPPAPAWSEIEQLNYEKESLGLYWSGHPIDRFADDLREYGARTTAELLPRRDGEDLDPDAGGDTGAGAAGIPPNGRGARQAEEISIGGIVSAIRPLRTRKGDRMCVFMLDDATGSVEVVVFPDPFKLYGHLIEAGQLLLVKGRFERDDDSSRVLASEMGPVELVRERLSTAVAIRLATPPHGRTTFEKLWDVFAQHKGDRRVAFDLEIRERNRPLRVKVEVHGQIRVRPSEQLVSAVERICGAGSVSLR
jgi:DNA polymerase-3 subunit alpha